MAKKKKEVELKEVSRTEVNGTIIIKYEDGSIKIIPAPIALTAEEAEEHMVLPWATIIMVNCAARKCC